MTILKVSAGVQVAPSGPSISLASAFDVDSYTKYEFVLTESNETKTVNLGVLGDKVIFAVIKADFHDSDAMGKPTLTYTTQPTTPSDPKTAKTFALDAPHLYLGKGFGAALKSAGIDFSTLAFTFESSATFKSTTVEILIGCSADSTVAQ